MDGIFNADDKFDFNTLKLIKPTSISGGNYFIKLSVNNSPLYIQPPKCNTKHGFLKAGKRYYTDLIFDNCNDDFIHWMENLVNFCQQQLFIHRENWFDGDMEMHDIENYFTSPLKPFKSGKFHSVRINVLTNLGNISIKIYDENENEVPFESIDDKSNVITILEISGIKCSATSFQLEIILKQMLLIKPVELFEKCIIKSNSKPIHIKNESGVETPVVYDPEPIDDTPEPIDDTPEPIINTPEPIINTHEHVQNEPEPVVDEPPIIVDTNSIHSTGLEEISFDLDKIPENDNITIKKRNDVYFEMYREAKRKAKVARDLALSTYLEAKRIKNTYLINEVDEDDESDEYNADEYNDEMFDTNI